MTSLLIATEDPHLLFHRLFNNSFQTLGFIKDRISQIFIDVLCYTRSSAYLTDTRTSRSNDLFPFAFQDLLEAIGSKHQQKTQDFSAPDKDSGGGGGDPEVVFNVLDAILKCSLERLKHMRESMSWAHIGHYNYKLKAGYSQHIDTIRNLSLEGRLGVALRLRSKMIHQGIFPDVVTHNYLINGFCKVNAFEKAEWLVTQMSLWGPSPNVATYNTLMKGYCAFGDTDKALDLISAMNYGKVKPNVITYTILVHAHCKKEKLEEARALLLELTDEYSEKTVIASTILMDSSFKKGDTSLAFTLWKEILSKEVDVVAYNVVIHGSSLRYDLILAYKYINQMLKIGFLPDNFTYNTLINTLCKMKRIDEAVYLYKVMSKMGVTPDKITYNILIQGLCRLENVVTAHELLNSMLEKSMIPPLLTWNLVIGGYGRHGDKQNTLHIMNQMMEYGVLPNVFTYNALIHMFIKRREISKAHLVMKEMISSGPLPDTVTYNLLVGAESEFGHLYSAEQIHDDMLERGYEPDVITYTKLIKGFCMRGKIEDAERIFSFHMLKKCNNLVIDHFPFQILIKKYFKIGNLDGAYGVYQKWLRIDQGQ
ncbi:pentatricopeptide repeat-containing protein At5g24830 [Lactuca sativa]|uniref:Pentacotripeptide-repeat region of PRORP domain-containing protein n=1 Tax=Lactuca sativa TaxID=4236 RepID=A0A9R1VJD3_LACSA|nr:pentatricopeptide repeat-containing protein At5g24830 [Lactuca sativa]XP_023737858.1 pentatricopeptide repeat-containing protein At5g24830 [Lactuca sativa]XP_023737859.1 pentatricopeptide repeat-containing protein At5g24830 [Lactuca sativa]KAJ0206103.1 hypothetical protein LSAT_V11C500240710 [Lactuca sativa]